MVQEGIMETQNSEWKLFHSHKRQTQDTTPARPGHVSLSCLIPFCRHSKKFFILYQSSLPTTTPVPFKYQALRWEPEGWKRNVSARLTRRSPQLHATSASPACRHAAIHRLITMEERSRGWVKVGCTDCNQLPVAVFHALHITFEILQAP